MGRRDRRATGPRRGDQRTFRPYHMGADEPATAHRGQWSASETAIDKWIAVVGTPEMTRTQALAELLAAAERANRERERGEAWALFYRVIEPRCRLVVRHQASGIRILTVHPVAGEMVEFEVDDAA